MIALFCFFETFPGGGGGGWLDIAILMKTKSSAFDFDFDWRLWGCQFMTQIQVVYTWNFAFRIKLTKATLDETEWCNARPDDVHKVI